jgi:hypothetical protein
MPKFPSIRSTWLRGGVSFLCAAAISIASFVLISFILPLLVVMWVYGPANDPGIGIGLIFVLIGLLCAWPCTLACAALTSIFFSKLTPAFSESGAVKP